jgi:integrase
MTAAKLYHVTSDDCTLPLHVGPGGVAHYPAHDIPQVLWPDGTVCWLVNLYLLSGYRKGRSRKNKGGTLLTWAKNLSHLVRWCFHSKTDIIDLTDSHFRTFVNVLLQERDSERRGDKKRSEPQVANICSTVLNFLAFVDERMPGLNLLGPTGRIHAEKKTFQVKRNGKSVTTSAWTHEHIPRSRRPRRRQPISSAAVNRLYEANATLTASSFVARRRFVMLRVMEVTGGRRIEASLLKVSDIEEATRTGELKVFTAKQRDDNSYRYVPVTQADLREILSFVKHYRQRVVRAAGLKEEHGFLFIAERTGEHLDVDTLTAELYVLRKAAGIVDEEVCLHAFRHRYITNIFRDLIRAHHLEKPSDLRRMLLSTETLKLKVMEWTGHSSIESLDRYIHLAFEAETAFRETLDLVHAKRVVESLQLLLADYSSQFRAAKPPRDAFASLAGVVEAAAAELGDLLERSQSTTGTEQDAVRSA